MSNLAHGNADLSEPVFHIDGETVYPTAHAGGPWNASLQHGSAPSALIARASEALPTQAPMRIARLTIDLCRPVPILPLAIATRIVRDGRKIQLSEIVLSCDGSEVVRGSVLKVRRTAIALPDEARTAQAGLPRPEEGREPTEIAGMSNPFLSGIMMRVVKGAFRKPGPAAIWFRAERPIVAGETTSPVMRAAITADFSNGASSLLDMAKWSFINGDLTVSLARDPIGDWILLDAESWLGSDGGGIAFAKLCDRHGPFGRAAQSLIVERVRD